MNPILDSWEANAQAWIKTIEHSDLESRKLVTNQAIIDTVKRHAHHSVLDVGCGEGWLARKLAAGGFRVTGTDAIQELVDYATQAGGGAEYHCCSYEQLAGGQRVPAASSHTAVFNFSLLDKQDTELMIRSLKSLLLPQGKVIIQTLHPFIINQDHPYVSGWRPGSWAGMKQPFILPYDHYFRTVADWTALLQEGGFGLIEMLEPLHPATQQPASLILVAGLH